jgi:opacity protein-like surface antigen
MAGNKLLTPMMWLLTLVLLLCFSNREAQAQEKSKKKTRPFEVELGLATIYDDNILKYSRKYLDRFINNEDEGRFHIKTYDDIIFTQSARISASPVIYKKIKPKLNIDFNNKTYINNSIKNWYSVGVGLQQNIIKRLSFRLSYSYIPDFYVRHFRDADLAKVYGYIPSTFVPFSFSKDSYLLWVQNTFKKTRVRLLLNYVQYFHNEHYTEYDCNDWAYGINILQPVGKNFKVEFAYQFTTSDARGYDEPGETKATADDADATYEEDEFSLGITWRLPRFKKKLNHNLSLDADFQKRYYQSEHYLEVDEEHAGRVDDNFHLFVGYDIRLSKSFSLAAFYNFYNRDSDTRAEQNQEYLSAEKDYSQNQVGVEVTYSFKF